MKGDAKVLTTLNDLLKDELTAINQYMVHGEMCHQWGYQKLHEHFEKRAMTEMKHAEKLIARIIFLEGKPVVSDLGKITVGPEVPKQFANDLALEMGAVKKYNQAIALCGEVPDFATREILQGILTDEDKHVDEIEEKRDQIDQMGIQMFLSTYARE